MQKKYSLNIILGLILFIMSFSWVYVNRGYFTKAGDAAGYIFMSYKFNQNEGFIFKDDDLGAFIKEYGKIFNYNNYYDSFVSNRYKLLNYEGYVAPRYPIGLSLFSSNFILLDRFFGLYLSNTVFFGFLVLIFYLLIIKLLPLIKKNKNNKFLDYSFFGLIGGVLIFSSNLIFQKYAIGQMMREISSIFFTLLTIYLLIKYISSKYKNKVFLFLSIFFYGVTFLIRETNLILGIIFLPFLFDIFKSKKNLFKSFFSFLFPVFTYIYLFITVSLLSNLGTLNEKFLNIDHIQSFSVNNFFNNFKKYLNTLEINTINFNNIFLIIALYFLFLKFLKNKNKRKLYLFLFSILLFGITSFILFSSWPNPYDRYIMVVFPIIYIFIVIGIYYTFNYKNNYLLFPLFLIFIIYSNLHLYSNIYITRISGLTKKSSITSVSKKEYLNIINYVNNIQEKYIYVDKNKFFGGVNLYHNGHEIDGIFPDKVFIFNSDFPEINTKLIEYVNRLNNNLKN